MCVLGGRGVHVALRWSDIPVKVYSLLMSIVSWIHHKEKDKTLPEDEGMSDEAQAVE